MRAKALAMLFVATIISVAQAQKVGIATNMPGNMWHGAGTAIAKLLNEKAGINATIQPFASPTVYLPAVTAGDPQFGFTNTFEASEAYEGVDNFAGRPNKGLRAVAIMFPVRNALYVRNNSPYKKISDLKGQAMPDGYTAGKIILPAVEAIYATAGMKRSDFKPIMVPTIIQAAEAFIAGKTESFVFGVGAAKVREADASVSGGIRALSVENTPATLSAIHKIIPSAYFLLEKPGPTEPGILQPTYVVAYDGLMFCSDKVPDEVVYRVTKAIYENMSDLTPIFSMFSLLRPEDMAKKIAVPYHPGAIKFYKEKGMWPPK